MLLYVFAIIILTSKFRITIPVAYTVFKMKLITDAIIGGDSIKCGKYRILGAILDLIILS